jgi:hypothetical protein
MNRSQERARFSTRKKLLFYAIYLSFVGLLFTASAEAFLRYRGVHPWGRGDFPVRVDPGGKFFMKHPTLGYTHLPGKYVVTLRTGYKFNVTNLPSSLRITHPVDRVEAPKEKDEIWIFGCSFTYGFSLNDEETYSWLLQERFPEYEVVNFGQNGYGTIHSLIQFQEALKTRTPKVAVLSYGSFHDERNTFSRTRRKNIAPWNHLGPLVQPYARLDNDGALSYLFADVEYREFPLMTYSALAHFIEIKYNEREFRWHRSHQVSEALVEEMAKLAKQHDVKFVVANIYDGKSMQEFADRNGIANLDISVDLSVPENTNRPHDNHPSAIANRQYADSLERYLRAELLDEDDASSQLGSDQTRANTRHFGR